MNMFDGPETNGDDNDADEVFDLIELPPNDIAAAWNHFVSNHIKPGRLLRLGAGLEQMNNTEQQHLESCKSCSEAYRRYSTAEPNVCRLLCNHNGKVDGVALRQKELWPTDSNAACPSSQAIQSSFPQGSHRAVPQLLRTQLHIAGPIAFGGNTVAFESWQFGRLLSDEEDAPVMQQLIGMIVDAASTCLLSWITSKNLLFVCFGRAMHRCGTRIAVRIGESGTKLPHVVLAHDYYSPTVVCDEREFLNADVIVLMDVVHSGATLNELLAMCISRGARRVRGLVLVDQSEGKPLCAEWHALWHEPKEERIPLETFVRDASEEAVRQLRRFEPNDEIALNTLDAAPMISRPVKSSRLNLDNELTKHIHATGALKRDYVIGKKRYPYVVNVLDLIKKSTDARTFVLHRAASALGDLAGKKVAVAFHAGRKQRAGCLANLLGSSFGWPTVAIGSVGPAFTVSDNQLRQLASYETVLIADAALRTGDTLSALIRAIEDKWLLKHVQFVALCVLNALSDVPRTELASTLGVEIRTLFDLPLSPPTEEVRHWANMQKAQIRTRMVSSGAFANLEQVLLGYCAPAKRGGSPPCGDVETTRELLENAVRSAQTTMNGSERIAAACTGTKPQFIRHLPVAEVVHDRNVQELLIGVMFNSVKPSLKESAAFALAAARNYEWMTLDWLKLNRPFIASSGDAWKSIVMVECEMKLSGRRRELMCFRDATLEFREEECARMRADRSNDNQLILPNMAADEGMKEEQGKSKGTGSTGQRVIDRLETFVAAAD